MDSYDLTLAVYNLKERDIFQEEVRCKGKPARTGVFYEVQRERGERVLGRALGARGRFTGESVLEPSDVDEKQTNSGGREGLGPRSQREELGEDREQPEP